MRFYEYESKQLLARHGIVLPQGSKVAHTPAEARAIAQEIAGPTVLKSQVLSGGRMKAGGVLFADTAEEAEAACAKILELEINGHKPRGVLVEGRQPIAQEYYLGVTWDGIAKQPIMIFSDMGGIDIEEVAETHPEHIGRKHFSTLIPFSDHKAKELVASVGITGSDIDRTHLFELLRIRFVVREFGRDLDFDEQGHQSFSLTSTGISSMRSATAIPASRRRSIFSAVVSALPSTIVPA